MGITIVLTYYARSFHGLLYMDIIKSSLVLLATLLLIACGSESDKSPPTEIIFPEQLPKVNPSLSLENQSGIWMVYRVTTENSEHTYDNGEIETL